MTIKPRDWWPLHAKTSRDLARTESSRMKYAIVEMSPGDWAHVRVIYEEGISTGCATFETDPGTWDKWDAAHLKAHRFMARRTSPASEPLVTGASVGDSSILGWAALVPVSNRPVYAGVAEVSVYVASKSQGHGVGRALLEALIASAERAGIWTLQALIFPENRPSLALHLRCGFREVGRRDKLGKLYGKWHDVLLLERRSKVAGAG